MGESAGPTYVFPRLTVEGSQFHDEMYMSGVPVLRQYLTEWSGLSGYCDSETSRMAGSRGSGVLGRVGPSVNSDASMSVVEVQGF